MSFSDYTEALMLDALVAAEPNWYIGASTYNPGETGANTVEPAGDTSYARMAVSASDFTRTGNVLTNDNEIQFAAATVDWGFVTYGLIWKATYPTATAANFIGYGALATPIRVGVGEQLTFAAGALTITLD